MRISKLLGLLALPLVAFSTPLYAAKTCELSIDGNDQMQFSKKEMRVGADCTEIKLTLKHVGKLPKAAMGHNWVLTKASDMNAVDAAAASAGPANDYIPKEDQRIIAHTKLIGGGETASVTFSATKLKAGEDYKFFCSFPGHVATMNGAFIQEQASKS